MQVEQFRSGQWLQQYQYKSFSPTPINCEWQWLDPQLNTLLERASRALAELNALSLMVPDVDLFIRMHIAKEANTSSRIEGTQTQMDEALIAALHGEGFEIAVETNGTQPAPRGLDWICVSPKAGCGLELTRGDEMKVVFPQAGLDLKDLESLRFRHFLIQPMDGPDIERNTRLSLAYCSDHPRWRLSLQTHKLLGIP